jgi:ankyrin repeat protein
VAFRPLRVAELAEILSFDFKTGPIPKFHEDLHMEDPVEAVLSTTSSLLAIVDVEGSLIIQFSHYSVKEYLTSSRLAETNDIILRHYHISMTVAHTLAAQACLSILLHLDKNVISTDSLEKYPLAEYAAEYWVNHARFEGVSGNVDDGMKRLFDPSKKHLAIWLWIHDPILSPWEQTRQVVAPPWGTTSREETPPGSPTEKAEPALQPRGSSLHYAAHCGLQVIVKFLIIQCLQDVHSRCFDDKSSPLHLASRQGHGDVALVLLEHGADLAAQTEDGSTPLHASSDVEVARLLLEHGADATARDKNGSTPLHRTLNVEVARLLLEHGADATARTNDGSTPLHRLWNVDVARLLLQHGADATARTNDGSTPLHTAWNIEATRLLLEHGGDVAAQSNDGSTLLHLASRWGDDEVVCFLFENGVDVTAVNKHGWTALHLVSRWGHVEIARLLLNHGADATAQNNYGSTPLNLALRAGHAEVARLLVQHGADTTGMNEQVATPWEVVLHPEDLELPRVPEGEPMRQPRTSTVVFVMMVIAWGIWSFLAPFAGMCANLRA